MLGKNLLKELLQYLRRVWPYALAVAATAVLAYEIILNDTNPYEMTGTVSAIGIFVMAAYAFVLRGFIHAYVSFYKKIRAENVQYFVQLYWARLLAFIIYMIFSALFLLAGVAVFAQNAVGQMFSAFPTEWPYFIEFLVYFILATLNAYLIPTTWIILFRFKKQKKLPIKRSLAAGIIALYLGFGTIILEIFLLVSHNSTTVDLPLLWEILVFFVAIVTIIDIRAYLLTKRTLKTMLYDTQF